jgi:hypothetical protein
MLKLIEIGLLVVTLLIVLGLIMAGQPEAPPLSEHAFRSTGAWRRGGGVEGELTEAAGSP